MFSYVSSQFPDRLYYFLGTLPICLSEEQLSAAPRSAWIFFRQMHHQQAAVKLFILPLVGPKIVPI